MTVKIIYRTKPVREQDQTASMHAELNDLVIDYIELTAAEWKELFMGADARMQSADDNVLRIQLFGVTCINEWGGHV